MSDEIFKFLITGSRGWDKPHVIEQALLSRIAVPASTIVVHGACPWGADKHAAQLAEQYNLPQRTYPADWMLGRSAGPQRNKAMVATLDPARDVVLAFTRNNSPGTRSCINAALAAGFEPDTNLFIHDYKDYQ